MGAIKELYGAQETNGLKDGAAYHAARKEAVKVSWTDPRLKRITRLRLLSDPGLGWWDVSYCHGELTDGTPADVLLPFSQLPKRNFKASILSAARRDKVFAKGLGLFEAISTLC